VIKVILNDLSEQMLDFKMIVAFRHSKPLCVDYILKKVREAFKTPVVF
jgi:hypothetical protein